jgi:hypothetical protein
MVENHPHEFTKTQYFDYEVVYGPGTDVPYAILDSTFLEKYFPKRFSKLYIGVQEEDPVFPRKSGDPVYPCIASEPWGEWGTFNFQVREKPLRLDEPRRYYLTLLYGGCSREKSQGVPSS